MMDDQWRGDVEVCTRVEEEREEVEVLSDEEEGGKGKKLKVSLYGEIGNV